MDRDQRCRDSLEDRVARRGGCQLVAEAGPVPAPGDGAETDPVGLEHTACLGLDIPANADHPLARPEQKAQMVAPFALDVDFPVPARARQLRQGFGIRAVRLVHPRRKSLVGRPRINAHHRGTEACEFPR